MNCPFIIRKCSRCGRILVVCKRNFGKQKNGKWGFKSICKQCISIYNKKHREKYYEENKDYILNRNKKYYEENKDYINEQRKKYREENPQINFNHHAKRRQQEENQGNGITKEQWYEMMCFFDWKCAYSGEKLTKESRTIDHIVALDNNGEHEIWNCVPCLNTYNYSKRVKNMELWYKKQDFFSKERLNKIYEWIQYAKNKWKS